MKKRTPFPLLPVGGGSLAILLILGLNLFQSFSSPLAVEEGYNLAFIEDNSKRTAEDKTVYDSLDIEEFINSQNDNKKLDHIRVIDIHDDLSKDRLIWQAAGKVNYKELPWMEAYNGYRGYSGPVPKGGPKEVLKVLERYRLK